MYCNHVVINIFTASKGLSGILSLIPRLLLSACPVLLLLAVQKAWSEAINYHCNNVYAGADSCMGTCSVPGFGNRGRILGHHTHGHETRGS